MSFFVWGFRLLDKWLQIKNDGRSLETYFEDNLISRIAIYGLGAIGRRLYEELSHGDIEVCYGIDRNAADIHIDGLEVKTLEDELSNVDAVVVTPIDFYAIEKALRGRMGEDTDIVFIEDIVDYCGTYEN